MLRDHQNNCHSVRLEWTVIWLIVIEVVVGVLEVRPTLLLAWPGVLQSERGIMQVSLVVYLCRCSACLGWSETRANRRRRPECLACLGWSGTGGRTAAGARRPEENTRWLGPDGFSYGYR